MTVWGNNCGEWSWERSLLIKSGILGLGVAFVLWAGWPHLDIQQPQPSLLPPMVNQSVVSLPSSTLAKGISTIGSLGPSVVEIEKGGFQLTDRTLLVDLNLGSQRELETLPGIGNTLAARIVLYRSHHGNFQHVEDLRNVSGIGKKRLKRLKSFVKIEEMKS